MSYRKRIFLSIVGWILALVPTFGSSFQTLPPVVYNYSPARYNAAKSNWSISQDCDGRLYAGNSSGLLVYDGREWKQVFPGGQDRFLHVRALLSVGSRTYLGSYREFGYVEENGFGSLSYTSLSDSVLSDMGPNDEIWFIKEHAGLVFFEAFSCCYVYDPESENIMRQAVWSTSSFSFRGDFYLNTTNNELKKWSDERKAFVVLDDFNLLGLEYPVYDVFEYGHDTIFVTIENGLYRKTPSGYDRIDHLGSGFPRVNRALICSDGIVLIGGIGCGVYAFSTEGDLLWHLDNEGGLQNNDILGMFEDDTGNVWLALDNGLSVIYKGGPSYLSLAKSGVGKITSGLLSGDNLYIGTNNGLYVVDLARISHVEPLGMTGQVWSLSSVDGDIIVGGNDGTMILKGGSLKRITQTGGGTPLLRMKDGTYLQGSFAPLYKLEHKNGNWVADNYLDGFFHPISKVIEDHNGNIWLEHKYQGIFCIPADGREQKAIKHYPSVSDIGKAKKIEVCRLGKRVIFCEGTRVYVYDDLNDRFSPFDRLAFDKAIIDTFEDTDGMWWVALSDNRLVRVILSNGSYSLYDGIDGKTFGLRLEDEYPNVMRTRDGYRLIPSEHGFLVFKDKLEQEQESKGSLVLTSVSAKAKTTDKETFLSLDEKQYSLYNGGAIRFDFRLKSCKYPGEAKVLCRMNGLQDGFEDRGTAMFAEYPYLRSGNYTFEALLVDNKGQELYSLNIPISVKPSFWLSRIAITFYVLLLIAVIFSVIAFVKYLLTRQRHRLDMLKEREIMAIKNDQLEKSLLLKSEDLARYSLVEAQRNKVLVKIKDKLDNLRSSPGSNLRYSDYRELMGIIDKGSMSSDEWAVFYHNFDLVHDAFFRALIKRCPSVTPSDLRFCAYSRLNMTTKEIADALGITVKGVEAARSRIRKKLDVPSDMSINIYLMQLSDEE